MKYKILLRKSEEGYSVSCPGLPGCWSQGSTESEALENIQDAIQEYLAARDELLDGAVVREVVVKASFCFGSRAWRDLKAEVVAEVCRDRTTELIGAFSVVSPGQVRVRRRS